MARLVEEVRAELARLEGVSGGLRGVVSLSDVEHDQAVLDDALRSVRWWSGPWRLNTHGELSKM